MFLWPNTCQLNLSEGKQILIKDHGIQINIQHNHTGVNHYRYDDLHNEREETIIILS